MFGPNVIDDNMKGIIPRACEHIFKYIEEDRTGTEFTIKCSFLEIYREIVRDLLDPERDNLKVRETPARGVWVQDLSEHYVASVDDVIELLAIGEKSRAVTATKMNAVSSRSHSLFILTLTQRHPDGSSKEGKLNLADLAGSEKVGKTGASGDTLEEAKKINQSLSALGNCINALTKEKRGHVPYRDSKLTHILRESLGGNSKTTLLIACSPHSFNIDETISTLKFGQRAKSIKNKVKINAQRSVAELEAIISKITKELAFYRAYAELLEQDIVLRDAAYDVATIRAKIQSLTGGAVGAKESKSAPATPRGGALSSDDGDIDSIHNNNTDDFASTHGTADNSPAKTNSAEDLAAFSDPSVALAELQTRYSNLRETLEMRLTNMNEEVEKLELDKALVEEKLKNALDRIDALEGENALLQRDAASQRDGSLKLSSLEHELKMKSLLVDRQNAELAHLRSSAQSVEDKSRQFNDIQSRLQAEKVEVIGERNRLQEQLTAVKSELAKAKEIAAENASLKDSLKIATARAENASHRAEEFERTNLLLRAQLESLHLDLEGKAQEAIILENALSDMKKRVTELENEAVTPNQAKHLETENSSDSREMDDDSKLQKVLATHREQTHKIMTELADATKRNVYLSADVQRKDTEITHLKSQLDSQQSTVEDTRHKLAQTDTYLITLQEKLVLAQDAFNEEKEKNITYVEEIEFRRKQMVDYEVKLRNILEEMEKTEATSRTRVHNAELALEESQSRVKQLEMIVEDFRKKNTDLLDQLQGTIEAHKQTQEQLQEARDRAGDFEKHDIRSLKSRKSSGNIVVPQILKGHSRATLSTPTHMTKRALVNPHSGSSGSGGKSTKPATGGGGGFLGLFGSSDPRASKPYEEVAASMEKEGPMAYLTGGLWSSFHERWVVLSGATLYMYEEKLPKLKPKKFLDIEGAHVHARKDIRPDEEFKYQLMITRLDYDKPVTLAAPSSGELNAWMQVIFRVASTSGSAPYFNVSSSASSPPAAATTMTPTTKTTPSRTPTRPASKSVSVTTSSSPRSPSESTTKRNGRSHSSRLESGE